MIYFSSFVVDEKKLVGNHFVQAMDPISESNQKMPHLENVKTLLMKGIGFHHSSLIPILKEAIEILFQHGLIKVNWEGMLLCGAVCVRWVGGGGGMWG